MKRVIGIGNALTDMLVNLESDSVLRKYLLEKGSMSLVDSKLQTEISKSVAGLPYSLSLGGSAGNTIRAMARLGCGTGFIGKVGPDTTGDFFEQALANLGVKPFIFRGSERSGKCVALISPDGERTMITHLGAALELTAAPNVRADIFEGFDCVYIEGYLVQNHELIEHTARTAKERGLQVAIDLASFNIVKENLDFLRALVEKYVDIVFANEDEAIAFTGENEPINALQAISQLCELAIVKIGIRGALIKHRSEVVHVRHHGRRARRRRLRRVAWRLLRRGVPLRHVRRTLASAVRHHRRDHGRQSHRGGRHDLRRRGVGGHLPAREEGTQRTLSLLAHSAAYDRCLFYTVTGFKVRRVPPHSERVP